MESFCTKIKSFLSLVTVEPVMFFLSLATHMNSIVSQTATYEVYCHQLLGGSNSSVNCRQLSDYPDAENAVQQMATRWNMMISIAALLPSLLTYVLLGAWSDKHGRKINILLGVASSLISVVPLIWIIEFPDTNLWLFVIAEFVTGLFGSSGLVLMSSFAYLADVVPDKDNRTVRMVIYSLVSALTGIIGNSMTSVLMEFLSESYILITGQLLTGIAFVYALLRLEQTPPSKMKTVHLLDDNNSDGETIDKDGSASGDAVALIPTGSIPTTWYQHIISSFTECYDLMKSVWHTYAKPRPGHGRAYLLAMTFVYCVYVLGEMGRGSTLSLFLFHSPFSWRGKQLGYFKSVRNLITFTGSLVSTFILKKFFKTSDTMVMLFSLFSSTAHFIVFGAASATWMLYLGVTLGCLGHLYQPAMKSFTSELVDKDEVGKSFVAYTFAADVALIVDVVASNSIYSSTVDFFPGVVFLICGGMYFVCFVVILCIQLDLRLHRRMDQQIGHIVSLAPNGM